MSKNSPTEIVQKEYLKALYERINTLESEKEMFKDLLSQFITKSNGLSKYVRADWVSVNSHHREVGERINDLYELQCDVEEILGEI